MFSKDWKLVAVLLATVSCLAACAKDSKKKSKSVPYTGLWINAKAQQELTRFSAYGDSRICQVVLANAGTFGISVDYDQSISLDAWSISGAGEVYRYSSHPASSLYGTGFKNPRYAGKISANGEFTHRNANLGLALFPPDPRDGLACYQAPFVRGNANVRMNGPEMTVWHPGDKFQRYIKTTKDELDQLNQALSICGHVVKELMVTCGYAVDPTPRRHPRAPVHGERGLIPVPPDQQ